MEINYDTSEKYKELFEKILENKTSIMIKRYSDKSKDWERIFGISPNLADDGSLVLCDHGVYANATSYGKDNDDNNKIFWYEKSELMDNVILFFEELGKYRKKHRFME